MFAGTGALWGPTTTTTRKDYDDKGERTTGEHVLGIRVAIYGVPILMSPHVDIGGPRACEHNAYVCNSNGILYNINSTQMRCTERGTAGQREPRECRDRNDIDACGRYH